MSNQERGAPHHHILWPILNTVNTEECSNCKRRPIAAQTLCFHDWCQECDLSLWETRHDGPVPGTDDNPCANAKTSRVDDIFRKNATKLQAAFAFQTARNEAEAALFPAKSWDSRSGVTRCLKRLELKVNSSTTPQEIGEALEQHDDLRHRLASLPWAEFIYKCRLLSDKLLFRCNFNNLSACHAVVRRAALLADEMASISTDDQIEQSLLTVAAEVAAEIDTMTRYIERDTAMFYRCHIRPILLEYDKVRNTAFDLYEIMFGNAGTKNIASAKSHRIIRLRRLKRQFTIERLT
jgi:hypothetical protein